MQEKQNSRATILDRLVDMEPRVSHEPVQRLLYDIRQIKAMMIRDIENLLNTRRQIWLIPASYKELNKSVFMYGLGDFTAENPKSATVRRTLRQDIERAIATFEPRLKNVSVHLGEDPKKGRNLKFRISGMLVVEPETEPISFDTVFDTNKGEYVIDR
jgi:type VI secretion system protein ImpF